MFTTWTTREGKQLKISEMETSHIQNCIAMLRRNKARMTEAEKAGYSLSMFLQGEHALDEIDRGLNELFERQMEHSRMIQSFENELIKREKGNNHEKASSSR